MQSTANKSLRLIIINGLIMALYITLTLLVAPISSGPLQFRISESLNHVVVFNRKLMWGVLGGVIFFNLFFGFGPIDALFGGMQTFLALSLTAFLQKRLHNVFVLLLLNTLFFTLSMCLIAWMITQANGGAFWTMYGTLSLSEFVVMTISAPLMYFLNQAIIFEKRV